MEPSVDTQVAETVAATGDESLNVNPDAETNDVIDASVPETEPVEDVGNGLVATDAVEQDEQTSVDPEQPTSNDSDQGAFVDNGKMCCLG
jgi:hypothetical protein